MKKYILFFVFALLLVSCNNQPQNSNGKKKYQYVEQVRKKNGRSIVLVEEKPETFYESSDTSAYIAACYLFYNAYKGYKDLYEEGVNSADEPVGFKLYNSAGEDITEIDFATKTQQEEEIKTEMMSYESIFSGMYSKSKLGKWFIKNYVNEFKEPIDEKYIAQIADGSFSNSITTNSNLTAILYIDKKGLFLELKEYGSSVVKDEGFFTFRVKDKDGEVSEFKMLNDDNGNIRFTSENKATDLDRMMSILLKGGIVKFYGESNRYGSKRTYNFNIHSECLQNALDELNKD